MRILIKGGTHLIVSEPAGVELGESLERFAEEIAEDAVANAREAGYQTVKQNHVEKALENRTSLNTSSILFDPER